MDRAGRIRAVRAQRGIGIVEILVATTLFAVVTVAALAHYQAARRAQAVGERLAELQQTTRAGFDRIARDLRAAGLAVDPDGDPLRPDEAIEGAFARALVVRADYDAGSPAADEPELALATGGAFDNVTTGNDEIVAYLLAKADGSSADVVPFDADVEGVPRDGSVETVRIASVSLANDDPPYTLYRVRVRPDSTASTRAPVADNVHSLRFTYLDGAGAVVPPPGGGDDEASRQARAAIRRIRVELVGVAATGDPLWLDAGDPHLATRHRRKFRLSSEFSPPNLALAHRAEGEL